MSVQTAARGSGRPRSVRIALHEVRCFGLLGRSAAFHAAGKPTRPRKVTSASRGGAGTPCFAARPVVIPSPRDLWQVVSFRIGFGGCAGTKMCQHGGTVVECVAHFVTITAAPANAPRRRRQRCLQLAPRCGSGRVTRQHGMLIEQFRLRGGDRFSRMLCGFGRPFGRPRYDR